MTQDLFSTPLEDLPPDLRLVAGLIEARGTFAHPLPAAEIRFSFDPNRLRVLSPRKLKEITEELRHKHGLPIGARRGKPAGYYWARTAEELEAAAAPMIHQGVRMLQVARRLIGVHRLRELLGQEVIGA